MADRELGRGTDVTGGLLEGRAEIFFPLRLGREGRISMKTLFWS